MYGIELNILYKPIHSNEKIYMYVLYMYLYIFFLLNNLDRFYILLKMHFICFQRSGIFFKTGQLWKWGFYENLFYVRSSEYIAGQYK